MGLLNRPTKPAAKLPSAAIAVASPMGLPAEMRAAMDAVTASLDARRAVDEAIARNDAERVGAETENERASEILTELDLAGALETDPAKLKQLEPKIEAARRDQEEAAQKVARISRLKIALAEKARETDERLRGDRTIFQIAVQGFGQQLLAILGAELREAAKPLLGVLLKIHAATYGLGAGRAMVGLLEEVKLPSAIWGEQPIISGSRYVDDRGETTDFATAWIEAPEAAALAEVMRPYQDLRRRLAAHQDYRDPPPPPKVQAETSQRNREAIARERQVEIDNDRRRAEAEAARPRAQPNSWVSWPGSAY